MAEDGAVRRVAWRDVCPGLILLRSFRLAISLPLLFLATMGTLLTPIGWRFAERAFLSGEGELSLFNETGPADGVYTDRLPQIAWRKIVAPGEREQPVRWSQTAAQVVSDSTWGVYRLFVRPFAHLLDRTSKLTEVAYYLCGGLWNVLIWAFFAGAITRIAAVQLGREERVGLNEAMRFARQNYGWYLLAPLFPLIGVALTAVPIGLLGLVMRLDLGVLIAGVVWLLVLLGGLVMVALLTGLLFGWPLMWPAISSEERGDAFEAFSRSYSYTFQRPLPYLGYALVAVLLGSISWLLVSAFSSAVVETSYWAAAWGAGTARIAPLAEVPAESLMLMVGSILIKMSGLLVLAIAAAFNQSFFWCASTAIYLLLRREVDQTEFDEVFVDDPQAAISLPPLDTDEAGVPGVRDEAGHTPAGEDPGQSPGGDPPPPSSSG